MKKIRFSVLFFLIDLYSVQDKTLDGLICDQNALFCTHPLAPSLR